jgi:hypothetical protein
MDAIDLKIVYTDTDRKECIIEIYDNNEIISRGNIGLELNPDGTANTVWIVDIAKDIVLNRRKAKAEQASIDKITSTINSIGD